MIASNVSVLIHHNSNCIPVGVENPLQALCSLTVTMSHSATPSTRLPRGPRHAPMQLAARNVCNYGKTHHANRFASCYKNVLFAESAGMEHNEPRAHQLIINQYQLMIIFSPHLSSSVHLFVFPLSKLLCFPVYLFIHISVSFAFHSCLFLSTFVFSCPSLSFPFHPSLFSMYIVLFSLFLSTFLFSCPSLYFLSIFFLVLLSISVYSCISFHPHFSFSPHFSLSVHLPVCFPVHLCPKSLSIHPSVYYLFIFLSSRLSFYPHFCCSCPSLCLILLFI